MPDLSHDTAEDGFHEIQLTGKQLVFLFIVTTSVVVGVFLFGVLVGRGARDSGPESTASASATPPLGEAPAATATPVEAPAPAGDEPAKEDLAYPRMLGNSAPEEKIGAASKADPKPQQPAVEPPPAPAPASPAKQAEVPAATPTSSPRPAPRAEVPAGIPTSGKPGTWLVQVMATREQAVAADTVKRLTAKGYPAFLLRPASGAPQPFYKVQVGRYAERSEADQVSLRLKKEEQFTNSWILR